MPSGEHRFSELEESMKKAAAALRKASVPFLLGGSLAVWAHGGPEPKKDLDLMVKAEDAQRALEALTEAGMKPEEPPEDWLLKAWDGEVLIDLIFHALELPITDDVIARGDRLNVFSIQMPVMALEDVVATKLLALNEHALDYESLLQISRAVREKVDWPAVWARTRHSPYARGFFSLVGELEVVNRAELGGKPRAQVRVVPKAEGAA
jgi:hypothetical protein